ncbi:MAG: helix-turn-helix transcriptional regulator [Chitinophaga sp.]|uniref:helix-turn-helix transcriptional regulator n=1 Tax=Chitinophaga sp. TaxID=1869181 RepID=UPI001B256F37|nr:helix-turn-helix transcriptional regulator [Chitinophaga sp.]MBO9730299.1 helix-turn-helix transcriptional regulator [Chitinophaga sp.]
MRYNEIKPCKPLAPYIKCYYIYESDTTAAFDDTVFPSGCVEIIFNLGSGHWQTAANNTFVTTPPIELWGQITRPLAIKSTGRNVMLGIRFYPHAAAVFLRDPVDLFNNQVIDFRDCGDKAVQGLYARLQDITLWDTRIQLVENFLLQRLAISTQSGRKIAVVNDVMREIRGYDFFDNIDNVASRYGITSRYLQKIFLQYTGLTPKLYSKIHRFQHSLQLLVKKEVSLTDIAYDCGYFDQSHFIREFKSFTGYTPSGYAKETSPVTLALANN